MTARRARQTAGKAKRYLAHASVSFGLFKLLFEQAESMLPPAEDCGDEPVLLNCELTIQEMATRLDVSRTTVQRDLKRLENYKWVVRWGNALHLGTRRGETCYLEADRRAEESTGAERLVSLEVLGLRPAKTTKPSEIGRGLARKWVPDGA